MGGYVAKRRSNQSFACAALILERGLHDKKKALGLSPPLFWQSMRVLERICMHSRSRLMYSEACSVGMVSNGCNSPPDVPNLCSASGEAEKPRALICMQRQ